MEDIFYLDEGGRQEEASSCRPRIKSPFQNSATSDEGCTPELEPSEPCEIPTDDADFIIADFEGFLQQSYQFEKFPSDSSLYKELPLNSSQSEKIFLDPSELEECQHDSQREGIFHYDPNPFPPFWVFDSTSPPTTSTLSEAECMEEHNKADPSTSDYVTLSKEEVESAGEEDDDDWSMATSEHWQLVSDRFQDGHSTPSDFVVPSVGTPSIPDELLSFTSDGEVGDQDEISLFSDGGRESDDDDLKPNTGIQWNVEDNQVLPAVRSRTLNSSHLSREDTLENDTVELDCPIVYDFNDNMECVVTLADPILSGLGDNDHVVRAGQDDNFYETEESDKEMDTPRAPVTSHSSQVTQLHSLCQGSSHNKDRLVREAGIRQLDYLRSPQADDQEANPSLDSLQEEESYFDSGNFQRMDDAYEYYPAIFNASKFDVFGSRSRKRRSARINGW